MPRMTLAILSALPEEQQGVIDLLTDPPSGSPHARQHIRCGGRDFWCGHFASQSGPQPVVLALAGIGKVAAATTATVLVERFGVRQIVFTGVAGGLGAGVRVGDVVVGSGFVQHDMDASPLFPRHEVPLYGRSEFAAHAALTTQLHAAATQFCADVPGQLDAAVLARLGVSLPRVHQGVLIAGDRFVATAAESQALRDALPAALAVDMESAAVAQVCHDFGIPFAAMRTVSDRADATAHVDFPQFLSQLAAPYARGIMALLLRSLYKK